MLLEISFSNLFMVNRKIQCDVYSSNLNQQNSVKICGMSNQWNWYTIGVLMDFRYNMSLSCAWVLWFQCWWPSPIISDSLTMGGYLRSSFVQLLSYCPLINGFLIFRDIQIANWAESGLPKVYTFFACFVTLWLSENQKHIDCHASSSRHGLQAPVNHLLQGKCTENYSFISGWLLLYNLNILIFLATIHREIWHCTTEPDWADNNCWLG